MSMEKLRQKMHSYFQEEKNGMQKRVRELKEAGNGEEAELEMGKLSVYDAFETQMETSLLKARLNPQYAGQDTLTAFRQEYLATFATQPAKWQEEYAQAKESGDERGMKLFALRLVTAKKIKDDFVKMSKGEAQ